MSPESLQTAFVCKKARDYVAAHGRHGDPEINIMTLDAITNLAPLTCFVCIVWEVDDNWGEEWRKGIV
jgi:hypothetical protein